MRKLALPVALALALGGATAARAQVAAPPAAPAAPAAQTGKEAVTNFTEIPDVDLSKLNPTQKALAIKIMNDTKCTCNCGYTIAGCRVKDSKCPVSPGLGKQVVDNILAGKTEAEVRKGLAPPPTPPPPPPLEDKVNTINLEGTPSKGAKGGKIALVEWSDFQCPFCGMARPWIDEILKAYPNDVTFYYKNYPLSFHQQAHLASQYALAAHAQGKFWPLHDKMYDNFKQITPDNLKLWAKEVGLDMAKVDKAIADGTYKAQVDKEMKEGTDAGVQGTPTFFINGKKYNGARSLDGVKPIIDAELKKLAEAKPAAAGDAKPAAKK